MEIQGKFNNKSIIIAEAGVNHNGNLKIAKKLIDCAVDSGANYVKFQTFKAEHLILSNVKKAPYQLKTTEVSQSQMDMLRSLEVTRDQNLELKEYCSSKNIIFLTTPFDEIDKCNTIGISSGASAPEILVNDFISNLKEKYEVEIEEVEIIKEDIVFKIPKKLN